MRRLIFRSWLFSALALFGSTAAMATPTTHYIDPSAGSNGSGSIGSPFNSWANAAPFTAGDTYLQKSGTTSTAIVSVTVPNVTFGAYNSGAAPIVGTFNFTTGSFNDWVSGFSITSSAGFGIGYQGGASNNVAFSNTITGGTTGILFAGNAGPGNTINNNTVQSATIFGIDVGQGTTGEIIFSNTVTGSTSSGIELEGDSSTVAFNLVTGNGASLAGASGIHTYAANASTDGGNKNIIAYNLVTTTDDQGGGDGNGIQLDQWTHGNTVTGNVIHNNQGAGISLYGTWGNTVTANAVFANMQGTLVDHGTQCEICVTANFIGTPSPTYANTLAANVMNATVGGIPNLYVDAGSTGQQAISQNSSGTSTAAYNLYAGWTTAGIPTGTLSTLHTALELMVSF